MYYVKEGYIIELSHGVGWGGKKTKIKAQITSVPVLGNDTNDEKISLFFHILYHPT